MSNDREPAFPRSYTADGHNGMLLRDYFAAQAMSQGMAVLVASTQNLNSYQLRALARTAYFAADAMLEVREIALSLTSGQRK